jgi:hypothetical protein
MDKDQILQMSRNENEGQPDEWEQSIEKQAAQVGKAAGLVTCILLVFLAEYVLHNRNVGRAAWIVFFAMEGTSYLCKYLKTKKRSHLFGAVLELFCAVANVGILIILAVM